MKASLFRSLWHLHLITPRGIMRLIACFWHEGITLMAVLHFAAYYHASECAVVSEEKRLNYGEFFQQSQALATLLYHDYHLERGQHVALLCRNHLVSALLLPALSRLGVHVKLLNTDLSDDQLARVMTRSFSLFIFDEAMKQKKSFPKSCPIISCESLYACVGKKGTDEKKTLPKIKRGGNISVMTGGSSGNYKEAARQTGIVQFLPPFFSLLRDLHIDQYQSVLIGLPFYHGFGLATLIISLIMGKKICLLRHFDVQEVLHVVLEERVEVMPIVPAMLARLWQTEDAERRMTSLKCVISGGDRLEKPLVERTSACLGDVLYNLYGTSEAGFFMLATPQELVYGDEVSIGRPIRGLQCEIRDADDEGVGTLWVKSRWAMTGRQNCWQCTGDRVWKAANGLFFHRGRADKMVVCGGENVYPEHVEKCLRSHPLIADALVFAVPDERFGLVLHAWIELKTGAILTEEVLKQWLKPQISRAEMPHCFIFGPIRMLSTGKRSRE